MMAITTGGELRQLGLLGIQMGAVDRFIIEVFPSLPPRYISSSTRRVVSRCDSHRLLLRSSLLPAPFFFPRQAGSGTSWGLSPPLHHTGGDKQL